MNKFIYRIIFCPVGDAFSSKLNTFFLKEITELFKGEESSVLIDVLILC